MENNCEQEGRRPEVAGLKQGQLENAAWSGITRNWSKRGQKK